MRSPFLMVSCTVINNKIVSAIKVYRGWRHFCKLISVQRGNYFFSKDNTHKIYKQKKPQKSEQNQLPPPFWKPEFAKQNQNFIEIISKKEKEKFHTDGKLFPYCWNFGGQHEIYKPRFGLYNSSLGLCNSNFGLYKPNLGL